MTTIELDDAQITFLMKLSREDLDKAQDELHPMLEGPDPVIIETARKALASRFDIYMKLLKASGLLRGMKESEYPYRDEPPATGGTTG